MNSLFSCTLCVFCIFLLLSRSFVFVFYIFLLTLSRPLMLLFDAQLFHFTWYSLFYRSDLIFFFLFYWSSSVNMLDLSITEILALYLSFWTGFILCHAIQYIYGFLYYYSSLVVRCAALACLFFSFLKEQKKK